MRIQMEADATQESSGYRTVPEGEYTVIVEEATDGITKDSGRNKVEHNPTP